MQSKFFTLSILSLVLISCNEEKVVDWQLKNPPACLDLSELSNEPLNFPVYREGERVWIDEDALLHLVLGGNRSLLVSAVQVRKAKQAVNLARSELLPSISLGGLLGSSVSPNFLVSSVDYLLPFLMPSRWADYRRSKHILAAEKAAFLISQMNQLASAYALWVTIEKAFRIREFLQEEYQDVSIIEVLTAERVELGELPASSLDLARSQVTTARARLWQLQRQINEELSHFRHALGLCREVQIGVRSSDLPQSQLEALRFEDAFREAREKSLEMMQLAHLEDAEQEGKWSKTFAFIGPTSAGESVSGLVPGEELSFAFSNLIGHSSVNFGFSHFSKIKMSSHQIDLVRARMQEVEAELQKILELNLGALKTIREQDEALEQSLRLLKRVFRSDQERFRALEISLEDLIQTQARLRQAKLEKLQVQTDLQLARLALHRIHRTASFELLGGCTGVTGTDSPDLLAPCDEEFVKHKLTGQ